MSNMNNCKTCHEKYMQAFRGYGCSDLDELMKACPNCNHSLQRSEETSLTKLYNDKQQLNETSSILSNQNNK